MVALIGLLRLIKKVSLLSAKVSPSIGTVICLLVSPGLTLKINVPVVAV